MRETRAQEGPPFQHGRPQIQFLDEGVQMGPLVSPILAEPHTTQEPCAPAHRLSPIFF